MVIISSLPAGSKSCKNFKRGETSSKVNWSVCLFVPLYQLVTVGSKEKPFAWKMLCCNQTKHIQNPPRLTSEQQLPVFSTAVFEARAAQTATGPVWCWQAKKSNKISWICWICTNSQWKSEGSSCKVIKEVKQTCGMSTEQEGEEKLTERQTGENIQRHERWKH